MPVETWGTNLGIAAMDPEVVRRDFARIAQRARPQVFAVVRRIVGEDQRAEEITQETFAVALERLDTYEGRAPITTWLCGIGKWLALGVVRRRSEALSDDGIVDPADPSVSRLAAITREERAELIRQAAESCLDPTEQEIAWLRYVEDLPREKIAGLLELGDAEDVRAHLARIKRRMQRAVRERIAMLGHGTSFLRTHW